MSGPGPIERRWTSQLHFKLLGSWPRAVVDERLSRAATGWDPTNVNVVMREVYEQAGRPVPQRFSA